MVSSQRGPSGKIMVPAWVMQKGRELLNRMSGEHASVYVGMAALMGPEGYEVEAVEEGVDLDPRSYGPLMIQGYNFLGGKALAMLLISMVNEMRSPDHDLHEQARELADTIIQDGKIAWEAGKEVDLSDEESALLDATLYLVRNTANAAIRQYLKVALATAGMEMQDATEPHDRIVAGVSQAVGMWTTVADSPIKFQCPQEEQSS